MKYNASGGFIHIETPVSANREARKVMTKELILC